MTLLDDLLEMIPSWKEPPGKAFAAFLIGFWLIGLGIGITIASGFTFYWILFMILGAICLIVCPCLGVGIIGASTGLWAMLVYIGLNVFAYVGFFASCISLLSLLTLFRDRSKRNILWVLWILLFHSQVILSMYRYDLLRAPLNFTLLGLSTSDSVKSKNKAKTPSPDERGTTKNGSSTEGNTTTQRLGSEEVNDASPAIGKTDEAGVSEKETGADTQSPTSNIPSNSPAPDHRKNPI